MRARIRQLPPTSEFAPALGIEVVETRPDSPGDDGQLWAVPMHLLNAHQQAVVAVRGVEEEIMLHLADTDQPVPPDTMRPVDLADELEAQAAELESSDERSNDFDPVGEVNDLLAEQLRDCAVQIRRRLR